MKELHERVFYSNKVMRPTDNVDENGKSTDVAGFFWKVSGANDVFSIKDVAIRVHKVQSLDKPSPTHITTIHMKYEETWSDEDCLVAVLAHPMFKDSDEYEDGEEKVESSPWATLLNKLNPKNWFSWFK